MKRAIITGATGAVGTAIVNELIKREVEVLVLCREGSKRNDQIPKHELIHKIICPLDGLSKLLPEKEKYDVFYHLAWEGTTGSDRYDIRLQNRNVMYTLDAIEVAKRFGCKRFVGAGSQAEYGRFEGKLKTDTPVFPVIGYGIAKLSAGLMSRQYANQLGLEHVWVRIVSIYGPNDGAQSLIMSTINKLRSGESPRLTKCEQQWDYLYSDDAGRAFVLLGERGIDGKTYVLGSGKTRKLKEYVKDIRNLVAPDIKLNFGAIDYYPFQVMHLEADISEIQADTNWLPETCFCDGIEKIINSMRN